LEKKQQQWRKDVGWKEQKQRDTVRNSNAIHVMAI
jgi:hypothetical protein